MVQRRRRVIKQKIEIKPPKVEQEPVEISEIKKPVEFEDFTAAPISMRSSRTLIFRIIAVGAVVAFILFVVIPWIFSGDEEPVDLAPPPPAAVEILNGCGIVGIAGAMTEFLQTNDIDVLITENADNMNYAETIVIGRDSLGIHAKTVALLIGVQNITYDYDPSSTANVTVILGSDYKNFKPFIQ